mgnify:FL=1
MLSNKVISKSPIVTRDIARLLGAELKVAELDNRHALCILLSGDLGAGKTAFAQGLAFGLGYRGRVHSPTFVLMKRYPIKTLYFKNLWHIDCYRIKSAQELLTLDLKKILEDPCNIVVIEWPEKIKKYIPQPAIRISFKHHAPEIRILTISA